MYKAPWAALAFTLLLSGCSTISGWFTDDEELEIRRLDPIEEKFEPQILWRKSVGDGIDKHFSRLRPAVGYDLVFAASRQGHVAAFEQSSGKQVWRQDFATYTNDGFLSGLSKLWSDGVSAKIAGGLVLSYETLYFGSEHGEVFALDAKSGEIKWRSQVKGEVVSEPAIEERVVVVNTTSGVIFALDADTGEQLWTYESEVPPLSLRGTAAPATASGGSIVGTANGRLVVNILESGQTAWEQPVTSPSGATELDRIVDIDGKPLILGGTIFVISFDGTLAAVELRSGRVIWKREYMSYRRLTMDGNNLFAVDNNSNVYSLDRRNGIERWSQGNLKSRLLTGAEPVGDYVVVGDKWGFLHWLDQETGEIVARLEVGDDDEDESIYVSPVADGNLLYTQTRDGKLFAIETPE